MIFALKPQHHWNTTIDRPKSPDRSQITGSPPQQTGTQTGTRTEQPVQGSQYVSTVS
jgi:hypothetical protein